MRRVVTQIFLDQAQVHTSFEQMGNPRVTQRVDVSTCVDAACFKGCPEGVLDTVPWHGRVSGRKEVFTPAWSREDPHRVAVGDPVLTKELEGRGRQWNQAVLAPLARADVDLHAGRVDVGHRKAGALREAQSAGVESVQADAVAGKPEAVQDGSHLLNAEDDRQLLLLGCPDEAKRRPGVLEGVLVEEREATKGDGGGRTRPVLVVLDVEERLAKLFVVDQIR